MKMSFRASLILVTLFFLASFKKQDKTWVAIGDSITYLNDHADETGNRVTKGYLTAVTEHFSGLKYVNQGHNGWTAANIAAQIDSLGMVPADIYSVFLGTNDWWQGRPIGKPEDYRNNTGNATLYGSFRIIIDKIRRLNPQAKILLITPMQRADFVYVNDATNNAYGSYREKNGQMLEDFANAVDYIGQSESIPVVDLYHDPKLKAKNLIRFKRLKDSVSGKYQDYTFPASSTISFNPATDEYPYPKEAINLTYDGLHPSDKGNAVIARAIVKRFKKFGL